MSIISPNILKIGSKKWEEDQVRALAENAMRNDQFMLPSVPNVSWPYKNLAKHIKPRIEAR